MNDLVNASDLFSYILYADDTMLFLSDDNLQSLTAKSNRELAKIIKLVSSKQITSEYSENEIHVI